jgi:ATP-dependent DNA helicase PIF1
MFNHTNLRDLLNPVIAIRAIHHSSAEAEKADTQTAGNLQKVFFVSINSRVMLTSNMWVERSLVNGSFGFVRDFVWPAGTVNPRNTMPLAILVAFNNYKDDAPYFVKHNGKHLVPLFPVRRSFGRGLARTQFKLVVAYAITVHKSQGISTRRAVLNISNKKEFAPGLTYVALSRVTTV